MPVSYHSFLVYEVFCKRQHITELQELKWVGALRVVGFWFFCAKGSET